MKRLSVVTVVLLTVLALSASGCNWFDSDDAAINPAVAPAAVGAVTLTPADNQLTVAWPPVPGAAAYEVWYGTADNSALATKFAGDADATDNVCVLTGLTNGTPYFIWVKAVNAAGEGPFGGSSTGTPAVPVAPPPAPASVTLVPGDNQIVVNWSAAPGATSYEVWYGTADDNALATKYAGADNAADTTCTLAGLSNGTRYYVWVKAVNDVGGSAFSAVSFETPAIPVAVPPAPASVLATPGDGSLTVTWSPASGATGYKVFCGTDNNSATATEFAGDADPADTTCTITGLSNGTLYYVWVKASNSAGDSGYSGAASATATAVALPAFAGNYGGTVPSRWVGSTRTALPLPAGSGNARAYSPVVQANGKSYVAGSYVLAGKKVPCYWDNDVRVDLGAGLADNAWAVGVAVSGTTVYTAGYYDNGSYLTSRTYQPCYWAGATRYDLPVGASTLLGGRATAIAVSGGDVYVAGYYHNTEGGAYRYTAALWKVPSGSTTPTRLDLYVTDPARSAFAWAIAVSGGAVYIAGDHGNNYNHFVPGYWLVPDTLAYSKRYLIDSSAIGVDPAVAEGFATAIAVSGGTVHVGGKCRDVFANYTPCYWTNLTRTDLPVVDNYGGEVHAIAVIGGTVYSAGSSNILYQGGYYSCYWAGTARTDVATSTRVVSPQAEYEGSW